MATIPIKPAKAEGATVVQPPMTWSLTKGGHYLEAAHGARLVQLADVCCWLFEKGSEKLPPKRALEQAVGDITAQFTPDLKAHLYICGKDDYAEPLSDKHRFENRTIGFVNLDSSDTVGYGYFPGLPDWLHEQWRGVGVSDWKRFSDGETFSFWDAYVVADTLCITHERAHALWGWGTVAADVVQIDQVQGEAAHPVRQPGMRWCPDDYAQLLARVEEVEAERRLQGKKDSDAAALKLLAPEFNTSANTLKPALRKARAAREKQRAERRAQVANARPFGGLL